ncbi:MAG: fatty acyl-AMP ligase, partial [Verrucomicrobium sp.]
MPDTPSASVVPLTESSSSSPAPSRHSTWVDHLRGTVARQGEAPALTFLGDGENESIRLTYASLDEKARAIASHLQAAQIAPGQRVLLLYPSGVEFVAALFGCLYAGVIAVPAFPPRLNRNLLRLQCIFEDALPAMVFTTTAMLPKREASPEMQSVPWVPTDTLPLHAATDWTPPDIGLHSIAFLQYTSGSTSLPKGVIVTHASLMANHEMLLHAFAQDRTSTFVVWLPLFHDMGLIGNVLQALYLGAHCVLMPPEAFVIKPIRWLQAISRYKAHTSGGPNFAYDLCVRKIAPSQLEGLDLRCWKIAFNGAEPVRAESLQNFHRAFASAGFAESSLYPCYGLAEATLFVAGGPPGEPPFIPPGEGTTPVSKVSCGHAWTDGEIRIVDPASHEEVAPGTSGEIWLRGSHIAAGYWNHPEETRHTFQARLAHSSDPEYLRTGDLG